jgi:hypothetical protein
LFPFFSFFFFSFSYLVSFLLSFFFLFFLLSQFLGQQLSDLFISVADINFGTEPANDADKSGDTLSTGDSKSKGDEKSTEKDTTQASAAIPTAHKPDEPANSANNNSNTNADLTAFSELLGTNGRRAMARGTPMMTSDLMDLKRNSSIRFFHSQLVNSFGLDSISLSSSLSLFSLFLYFFFVSSLLLYQFYFYSDFWFSCLFSLSSHHYRNPSNCT